MQGFEVISKPTEPFSGQKTGTSGLRKKTDVFMQENYLANWIQSLFLSLGDECKGTTMGLGGDGRYFNKEAVQIILKVAAGEIPALTPFVFSNISRQRDSILMCTSSITNPHLRCVLPGLKRVGSHSNRLQVTA